MQIKKRESNFELLRIIMMIGVIILHINGEPGNAIVLAGSTGVNGFVINWFEAFFNVAVDTFILVSGYFLCTTTKRKMIKPLQMIFEVILFSAVSYPLLVYLGVVNLSAKSFIVSLVPRNYYVVFYVCLYILSPYINIIFEKIGEKHALQFVTALIIIFSIWPTIVDVSEVILKHSLSGINTISLAGSQFGYNMINFFLLYCIGAYLKMYGVKKHSKKWYILWNMSAVTFLCFWAMKFDSNTARSYCNPILIFSAVLTLLFFKELSIPYNKVINRIASASFTVFLCHPVLIRLLNVEYYVKLNPVLMVLVILACSCCIYAVCMGLYEIYRATIKKIFDSIENRYWIYDISE